jgi:hypothetical protein
MNSGGTLKALDRYGQGLASTEFQNDFARDNTLAGYGMQGAQGNAAAQSGYANLLQRSAAYRNGIYTDRGNATADQYGAGADIGNALFGSNGLFGNRSGAASGGGGFGSGFDFTGGFGGSADQQYGFAGQGSVPRFDFTGGSGFGSTFAGF